MTKFNYKQKFPCGYELEMDISGFGLRDFSGLPEIGICPIHGKKCVKGGKDEEGI
jgi:hypothetical protein